MANGNGQGSTLTAADRREIVDLVRSAVSSSVPAAIESSPKLNLVPGVFLGTDPDGDGIVKLDTDDPLGADATHCPVVGPHPTYGARVAVLLIPPMSALCLGEVQIAHPDPKLQPRITVDSASGQILWIDDQDSPVGSVSPYELSMGIPGTTRTLIDPIGGARFRDDNDILRAQISPFEGVTLREGVTGVTGVQLRDSGLLVIDPASGDSISIQSGTSSSVPTPKWASSQANSPGSSHSTPDVTTFATGDDLDLRFVCASLKADAGATSYTPPTNYTERSDIEHHEALHSLATSSATRDPAITTPGAQSFTNTSSAWSRRNGHSVIVRGPAPAFRSIVAPAPVMAEGATINLTVSKPSGVVEGDLLFAFVSIASSAVPVNWSVPPGWVQLGVQVAGLGTDDILASGIWYKRAGASEPSSYSVTINMSTASHTVLQATGVAVQAPYAFPAGLDIRRNNRSMPRGLIKEATPLTSSTTDWAYSSLPQTIITCDDVPLLAGRKYRPQFYCTSILTTLTDGNAGRWALTIERDGGSGFVGVLGIGQRERYGSKPGDFTYDREPMSGQLDYVPSVDETADWRVRLSHLGGINYSVQLEASGTGPVRFWFDDIGAVF